MLKFFQKFIAFLSHDTETLFWLDLTSSIEKAGKMVSDAGHGSVYGCKVSLMNGDSGVKIITRYFSKSEGSWEETTVSKVIPKSNVPPAFLERMTTGEELDITDELEMQLESA